MADTKKVRLAMRLAWDGREQEAAPILLKEGFKPAEAGKIINTYLSRSNNVRATAEERAEFTKRLLGAMESWETRLARTAAGLPEDEEEENFDDKAE
jgi:hypothetical protein